MTSLNHRPCLLFADCSYGVQELLLPGVIGGRNLDGLA